ncbi:MAG: hypothetical protein IPH95_14075 [Candidatus Promineofilum sp.]|nr:hypothetical protein [Promineifilum sp.]
MAEINHPYQNQRALPPDEKRPAAPALLRQWWFRLIALLFVTEFIVPFILWQAGLPRTLDVFREAARRHHLRLTLPYMLLRDKIPAAVLVILAISLIWGVVSIFDGQAPIVTFWGWWRLFKYPLLAVFAFLIPRWPDNFARWLVKFFVLLLAFQVGVQLVQWAAGQTPGDSLAGTFGNKGVGPYTVFIFFTVCVGLGHWLATGEWKLLAIVLVLGLVGTMLSVTKFYLLAAGVMGIVALVIHMVRGGRFRTLLIYVILAGLAAASFVPIYNNFIATTRGLKPLQEYLTAESINNYLFKGDDTTESGSLKLGRGYSVLYAWQQIQRDYTTFLFGYGIGGRTSSAALGLAGPTLEESLYGRRRHRPGCLDSGVWPPRQPPVPGHQLLDHHQAVAPRPPHRRPLPGHPGLWLDPVYPALAHVAVVQEALDFRRHDDALLAIAGLPLPADLPARRRAAAARRQVAHSGASRPPRSPNALPPPDGPA